MPREQRATTGELETRYAIIRDFIVRGFTPGEGWRFIRDQTDWGISRRQVYNYFDAVQQRMADEASTVNRAMYFTRQLGRLDYLYHSAIMAHDPDLGLARQVTMDVVKLLRLDTPEADFDWQRVAAEQGLDAGDILTRMKRLMVVDDEQTHVTQR